MVRFFPWFWALFAKREDRQRETVTSGDARQDAIAREIALAEKRLSFFQKLLFWLVLIGVAFAALYGALAGRQSVAVKAAATASAKAPAVVMQTAAELLWSEAAVGLVLALSLAGAACALGAFAGFLFGLPRTLASGEVRQATAESVASHETPQTAVARSALGTNTNLEQISDWLTKIIVGVGLTKLEALGPALERFGDKVEPFFGFGGKVYGIGGGLYFLILGFFVGYIFSRTKLTWLFVGSENINDGIEGAFDGITPLEKVVQTANAAPLTPVSVPIDNDGAHADAKATADVAPDVRDADETLLATNLAELNSEDKIAARAAAEARAGNTSFAKQLYNAILPHLSNPRFLSDYVGLLGLTGERQEAERVMAQASVQTVEARANMLLGLLRAGLYNGQYEQSIEAGEELLRDQSAPLDAFAYIWLACAYGQRHAACVAEGETEKAAQARGKVIANVREALKLSPLQRGFILTLYDPALQLGEDSDLQSLFPDEELDMLLGRKTAGEEAAPREEAGGEGEDGTAGPADPDADPDGGRPA